VAVAAGLGAKKVLGFSGAPGYLPGLLGEGSFWLDPLAALGTVGIFGVAYVGVASLLGVGVSLRRRPPLAR
jgi:hypothetical protein